MDPRKHMAEAAAKLAPAAKAAENAALRDQKAAKQAANSLPSVSGSSVEEVNQSAWQQVVDRATSQAKGEAEQ